MFNFTDAILATARPNGCQKANKVIGSIAFSALAFINAAAYAQQPTRDVRAMQPTIAPTLTITALTYEGAARQWATGAFFIRPATGLKISPKRYGQIVSFASNMQFSFVNPGANPISVSIACFDAAGENATVKILSSVSTGTFADPNIRVAGNGALVRLAQVYTAGEAWCRVSSSNPFLFSAALVNHERLTNPDDAQDRVKVWQTPISSFMLVK